MTNPSSHAPIISGVWLFHHAAAEIDLKPLVTCMILATMMFLLAAVAIGAMISISNGKPNWLLIGVFVADSIALLLLAAYFTLKRRNNHPP